MSSHKPALALASVAPRCLLTLLVSAGASCGEPPAAAPPAAVDGPSRTLTTNGTPFLVALRSMASRPFSADGLEGNPEVTQYIENNPSAGELLQALASCALPGTTSFVVHAGAEAVTLTGEIGLAPDWGSGPCDEACQEWVSACQLVKVNAFGVHVYLSSRAPHPQLREVSAAEARAYPVEEGAFYGNLYTDPPQTFACRGRGSDPIFTVLRTCVQPGSHCGGLQVVGTCGDVDGATGLPTTRRACASQDTSPAGSYLDCHDALSAEGTGAFPATAHRWTRPITVFLRRSNFTVRDAGAP